MTLYEGAIYMVQARPWQVERLDWEGRKAFVRQTQADYYTDAIDYTRLKVLDESEHSTSASSQCTRGEVHLVRRVAGYKKVRFQTHENVGYGNVKLPDQEMHTTAVWWQVNPDVLDNTFAAREQALDGFLGAAYAMHFVATLLTMSDLRDVRRAVGSADASWCTSVGPDGRAAVTSSSGEAFDITASTRAFIPTVFLYDNYPGGIGLTAPLFDLQEKVVTRARELVAACACKHGCPACIGPILAPDKQTYSPKESALRVLTLLADLKA
jgi:DEAD/DEAH box helicase domain-containing protein